MRTLPENHKPVNVYSMTCSRCRQPRSRKGAWVFDFDPQLFLCACCIETMEREVLRDYERAASLIRRGDAA